MKQKIRKYILPIGMLTLFGSIILASAAFQYPSVEGFPNEIPVGEKSGGTFRNNFENFFQSCGTDKIALGYSSGSKSLSCISLEELREAFKLVNTSNLPPKTCTNNNAFLVGFTSTGDVICETIQ